VLRRFWDAAPLTERRPSLTLSDTFWRIRADFNEVAAGCLRREAGRLDGAEILGRYSHASRIEAVTIDVNSASEAFGLAAWSVEPEDACLTGSRFFLLGTRASSGSVRKEPQCLHEARARGDLIQLYGAWRGSLPLRRLARCFTRKRARAGPAGAIHALRRYSLPSRSGAWRAAGSLSNDVPRPPAGRTRPRICAGGARSTAEGSRARSTAG
jgi:hypothetical protein